MKQGKRLLSLSLALAMALSLTVTHASAVEAAPEEAPLVEAVEAVPEETVPAKPVEEEREEASLPGEEELPEPETEPEAVPDDAPEIQDEEIVEEENFTPVETSSKMVTLNSEDGDKQSDIQKALKNASEGDIIRLKGSFKFSSALKLYSGVTLDAGSATITSSGDVELMLNLYKVDHCTVKGGKWKAGASTRVAKLSGCEDCTLSGMTIIGGDGEDPSGSVYLYRSDNTLVEDCSFSDTRSQALYANQSDDLIVTNGTFEDIGGYAIHTYYSNDPVLVGNTISDCCGDGIYSSHSEGGTCSGNTISHVTANDELDIDSSSGKARSGNGIFLSGCEDYDVGKSYTYQGKSYVGNVLQDLENYGIHLNVCDGTDINRLTSEKSGNDGVHISASDRTTVRSCVIHDAGKAGISTTPGKRESKCQDSVIADNEIDTCVTHGIWVNQSDNTKVVGNQITKTEKDGVHCSGSATDVKISGNTISKTTSGSGSGIGIYSCTNTAIGGEVTWNDTEYKTNTIKNVKKYGVDVSKSNQTKVKNCTVAVSSNTGIRISESTSCTVSGNTVKKAGSHGIYVTSSSSSAKVTSNKVSASKKVGIYISKSKKAVLEKNTVSNPGGKGVQVSDSSGCTIKTVNVPTINKVTSSSTKVKGKITKGNSAKIKVGDKYYACTVDGTSFTSKKFPKQETGTTLYLREYPGSSNVIITSFQVQ